MKCHTPPPKIEEGYSIPLLRKLPIISLICYYKIKKNFRNEQHGVGHCFNKIENHLSQRVKGDFGGGGSISYRRKESIHSRSSGEKRVPSLS